MSRYGAEAGRLAPISETKGRIINPKWRFYPSSPCLPETLQKVSDMRWDFVLDFFILGGLEWQGFKITLVIYILYNTNIDTLIL
jgi:hypothetical protein